jgi:DNA polymerase-1
MSRLVLIDGNSVAFRAFYGLPLLSNSQGLHTNAVFGFTTMLLKLIEEQKPTHFLVAFDAGKITFRHKQFEGFTEYKGGREKTPPELSEQFPLVKELLRAFQIPQFELSGYEADDIIGTMTRLADEEKLEVLVVSGDKDMLQLASEHVTIGLTRKGVSEMELFDPAQIMEKYGLVPKQIIDLKGLMGDASDNIPGIPGVGEKTALKLLHEHGSVESVIGSADQMKGKIKEKIEEHKQSALMSKELATIFREVPELNAEWDKLKYEGYDPTALQAMFRKLEFKSLLEKLDFSGAVPENDAHAVPAEALEIVIADQADGLAKLAADLTAVTAVHIELAGENPHTAAVLGAAFYANSTVYVVPTASLLTAEAAPVRDWLELDGKSAGIYDVHRTKVALEWLGIKLSGFDLDVQLAAYLLDPTAATLTLESVVAKHGLHPLQSDEAVFGKGAKFQVPALGPLSEHLARKAASIAALVPKVREALETSGMHRLYYELELPLATVLAQMEHQGISVDADGLKAYGVELTAQLEGIMKRVYEHAGVEFNVGSPKQLGDILFDKLGLPVWKKTKTGYSTDAEVLEKLAPYHPIVNEILHYRSIAKLTSTYVEGLLKEVRPETGKVHTYYQQTIAATGRLSSQFPNLQNIPIRMEEGRKIRKVFVPAESGWSIMGADYSQIELRVLAHISGDEKLKEAFVNNMDIHTKTAMDVFGVAAEAVDANMRRQAKAVNFGIVYGISDYGLSQNLNITRKEAASFIEQYFEVFRGVRQYMDDIVKEARQNGYVTTLLNRRRYLPEITASNFNIRSFAERTAMNTPIQGTAADIIKLAMVQIENKLREEKMVSRMLLSVHDELVFEVPQEELDTMRRIVPEVMESALTLDVPLKVDVDYGANWYEAK